MNIFVTGGAGYIGSHVCKALKKAGFNPITFDNLSHGHREVVRFGPLFEGNLCNASDLDLAFTTYQPQAVIHLAGSINLRESIENPFAHYSNNVCGTLSLLNVMVKHSMKKLVFSSSAAVYSPPRYLPIDENHPTEPLNPYGRTKWMAEKICTDFYEAHGLCTLILRYFNAAGADPEGELGEAHYPETHLIPRIIFTAQKKQPYFTIYNDNHNTPDGTAIRDFVHVSDLAEAHVLAVKHLLSKEQPSVINLGAGKGYSVKEVLTIASQITNCPIPVKIENKEIAELPVLVADTRRAHEYLGWTPKWSDLPVILETAWRWHNAGVLLPL